MPPFWKLSINHTISDQDTQQKKKRRHNQTPAAPALNMWMQDALESSHGQGPSNVRLKRSGQLPMKSLANQIALKVISGCKCLPASGTKKKKKNEMGVGTMVTYCGSVLFAFFIGPPAKGAGIRAAGAAAMEQCSNQDQDQEQCTCNYYKYIVLAFISWGMWGVGGGVGAFFMAGLVGLVVRP